MHLILPSPLPAQVPWLLLSGRDGCSDALEHGLDLLRLEVDLGDDLVRELFLLDGVGLYVVL